MKRYIQYFFILNAFFILGNISSVWAQSLEDEVKELNTLYEKVQRDYWNLKQNNLRKREEIKDRIDNLDSVLKTRYEKRNSLTEELFLVTENLNKAKEKLEETRSIEGAFKTLLFETVNEESENVGAFYPKMIEPATAELNRIKGVLEADPLRAAELIIDYKSALVTEGEVMEIYRTKILNQQTQVVQDVGVLRLGFIHSAFSREDFSGILLREGGLSGTAYKWVEDLPSKKRAEVEQGVTLAFNHAGEDQFIDIPIDTVQTGNRLRSFIEEEVGLGRAALDFFIAGGIVMYPLMIVALLSLFISYDRIRYFWQFRSRRLHFLDRVKSLLQQGDLEGAKRILQKKESPFITHILLPFFERRLENRKQAEIYLQDQYGIHLPEMERGLSGLAVLAAVAPLLGLLGTVTGMIELFDVITLYGSGNPKILASGISVALITTQTGLTIAVPLILIHHYFVRWKTKVIDLLDGFAIEVVNILYPSKENNRVSSEMMGLENSSSPNTNDALKHNGN